MQRTSQIILTLAAPFILVACSGQIELGSSTVTPEAVRKCLRCHYQDGPAIAFDAVTTPALAGLIDAKVTSGEMPPWVPSRESPTFVGDYSLSDQERADVLSWARGGAQYDLTADSVASHPEPDATVQMAKPYIPPPSGDEYRCFVAETTPVTIGAYRWRLGRPAAIHHETAMVLSAQGATAARARDGVDGRPGFDCLVLPVELETVANLGASGVGPDTYQQMPPGVGASVPPGGVVLIQMHYVGSQAEGDVSALDLWAATGKVDQLQMYALWAPVELPCPSGVSTLPSDRCSREHAVQGDAVQPPDVVRSQEDGLLANCGTTLARQTALAYSSDVPDHFLVSTECVGVVPYDATAYQVHGHMHTRGTAVRVDAEVAGAWRPLLVIDVWQWWWERPYNFVTPVTLKTGQRLRVQCVHDNGAAAQWSLLTGQPSHDRQVEPPLDDPSYRIMGFSRTDEMCEVFLGVTRD